METLDKELDDAILELQGDSDLYNLDELFDEMSPPKKKVRIGFPKTFKPYWTKTVEKKIVEPVEKKIVEPVEKKIVEPVEKKIVEPVEKKIVEKKNVKRKIVEVEKKPVKFFKPVEPVEPVEKKPVIKPVAKIFKPVFKKTVKKIVTPIVTKHRNVMGVLAMRADGYTLTDGHRSFSSRNLDNVSYDIFMMRIQKLYLVDETSYRLWDKHATNYVDTTVMELPTQIRECPECCALQCHRWWAFHYGIERLLPFSDSLLHHDQRRVVHPTDVVLCITSEGYTITNGRISLSMDGDNDDQLIDLMYKTRVKTVYVMDDYPEIQNSPFEVKRIPPSSVGPCHYCQKGNCHRWKAVVGGISKIMRYPVDPIRH